MQHSTIIIYYTIINIHFPEMTVHKIINMTKSELNYYYYYFLLLNVSFNLKVSCFPQTIINCTNTLRSAQTMFILVASAVWVVFFITLHSFCFFCKDEGMSCNCLCLHLHSALFSPAEIFLDQSPFFS